MSCKFALADVVEKEVAAPDAGYDAFEPTVSLEIDRTNVFHSLGIEGAKNVVIMHSRERMIGQTFRLIQHLPEGGEGHLTYWLLGTGFGFRVSRKGRTVDLFLEVDGQMGPTQGVTWPQTIHAGTVSVGEWVRAVVSLSRTLSGMFLRLNPDTYHDPLFQKQEAKLSELDEWLGQSA